MVRLSEVRPWFPGNVEQARPSANVNRLVLIEQLTDTGERVYFYADKSGKNRIVNLHYQPNSCFVIVSAYDS